MAVSSAAALNCSVSVNRPGPAIRGIGRNMLRDARGKGWRRERLATREASDAGRVRQRASGPFHPTRAVAASHGRVLGPKMGTSGIHMLRLKWSGRPIGCGAKLDESSVRLGRKWEKLWTISQGLGTWTACSFAPLRCRMIYPHLPVFQPKSQCVPLGPSSRRARGVCGKNTDKDF
jgi:hypothetical protein